jgi:hypothetical protein
MTCHFPSINQSTNQSCRNSLLICGRIPVQPSVGALICTSRGDTHPLRESKCASFSGTRTAFTPRQNFTFPMIAQRDDNAQPDKVEHIIIS